MADSSTSLLGLTLPEVDVEDLTTDWGAKLNADLSTIDSKWTSTTPATQTHVAAGTAGSSLNVARADHVHPMAAIVNADVSASAAIAYSKLALTGTIVNADVAAGAAIARNKLAALTASRVMVTDASGFDTVSSVTTTTLAFLDATSSVQTQLDAKMPKSGGTFSGAFAMPDGAVGTPSAYFTNATTTGLYLVAANTLGIAANGVDRFRVGSSVTVKSTSTDSNSVAGALVIQNANSGPEILRFSGQSGPTDVMIYLPGSTAELRFAKTDGATTTDLLRFTNSGHLLPATDNSYDLGSSSLNFRSIYAKTSIVLQQASGGTNAITISAPSGMTGNLTMTLPATAGASGQTLKTDGAGVLSWGAATTNIGLKNYLSNSDAETDATSWNTYADAAGTSPVDGTGGSASITIARSTSSPLRGAGSFLITKGATNRQGDGVSTDFTIDSADQAKVLQVSFDYNAPSGFVAGDSSDIRVWIYDVTNAALIPVTPSTIQGGGTNNFTFKGLWQSNYNSTSYRLILHVATTNATAWTFKFDNVVVGTIMTAQGAPIGDWTAYTPTYGAGFGTVANSSMYYRRVGDSVQILGSFQCGTVAASTASFTLPSGMSIDYTKVSTGVGASHGFFFISHGELLLSNNDGGAVFSDGSTLGTLYFGQTGSASSTFVKMNGNSAHTSNYIFVQATVPVLGWGSTVVMSNDTDTRVVAMAAMATGAQSFTNNTQADVTGWTTENDTHGAFTASTGVYTVQVSGWYRCYGMVRFNANSTGIRVLALYKNNATNLAEASNGNPSGSNAAYVNVSRTVYLTAGDNLRLQAYQNSGGALALQSTSGYNVFTVERLSGPSAIAASEYVAEMRRFSGSQLVSAGGFIVIDFTASEKSTHGGWTSGVSFNSGTGAWTTSPKYTVPVSGDYEVACSMEIDASSNYSVGQANQFNIYKNGSGLSTATDVYWAWVANTTPYYIKGTRIVPNCVAGDTIDIRVASGGGASSVVGGFLSIKKVNR